MVSLIALITVVSLGTATGCNREPAAQPETARDPFYTTYGFGDEQRKVSLSGNTAGHAAGETSEFTLTLDNSGGDATWKGEYCVLLLDREGIVMEITRSGFDIQAGTAPQTIIPVEFAAGAEGPFGLAVVIPKRMEAVTTIWIGKERTGIAGPWPRIDTCPRGVTGEEAARQPEAVPGNINP